MKRIIKILHVINSLTGGGAEKQCLLLAKSQAQFGHIVYIALNKKRETNEDIGGVSIFYLGGYSRYNIFLWINLLKSITKINPDVTQSWLPNMDILTGILCFFTKKKYIMTERSTEEAYVTKNHRDFRNKEIKITYNSNSYKMYIDGIFRYFAAANASVIVANSLSGVDYWKKKFPRKKICKINNILTDQLKIDPNNKEEKIERNYSFFVIGSLENHKSPFIILHTAKKMKKILSASFNFYGKGSKKNEIIKFISDNNLKNIIFLNDFKEDWVLDLDNYSALIHASYYEGQPNSVLEAMQYKIPIILSDIAAHREILDNESAYFFQINNYESLISQIKNVISDLSKNNESKTLEANNKVSSYTAKKVVDHYNKLYNKII